MNTTNEISEDSVIKLTVDQVLYPCFRRKIIMFIMVNDYTRIYKPEMIGFKLGPFA